MKYITIDTSTLASLLCCGFDNGQLNTIEEFENELESELKRCGLSDEEIKAVKNDFSESVNDAPQWED